MFRQTVLIRALTVAFSAAAMTAVVTAPVMAQSNATGNIFGRVDSPAGSSVVLLNTDTGLKRTVTPDANGRYQVTALPTGRYKVELVRNGATVQTNEVDVVIGQGAEASFVAAAPTAGVQQVQISGRRSRIDVSSTNNSTSFSAKELAALPVGRSVDAIIQLAPNTTRADSRYAGGASFGGGGASENAYYINGFPVTNPLTQLGASELPFGGIAQAQIMTGGFGAEFGRSVGGVVNITTKSGTNKWEAGVQASYTPKSLRSDFADRYYAMTGDPANAATDNALLTRRRDNTQDNYTIGAYVGGPIIKDKLFIFAGVERITNKTEAVNLSTTAAAQDLAAFGWVESESRTDRHLVKLDWNITDAHRLEFTSIGDTPELDQKFSDYNYATGAHNGNVTSTAKYENANGVTAGGATVNMLKYTGNLTDNLTLTALYGESEAKHKQAFGGAVNPNSFGVVAAAANKAPGVTYPTPSPFAGAGVHPAGAKDTVKSSRLDIEYKVPMNFFGTHTIRAGIDDNKLSSTSAGTFTYGGGFYSYLRTGSSTAIRPNGSDRPFVVRNPANGPLAMQGYYGREQLFEDFTNAYSDQAAQYIEDKIQMNNVLVSLGLRRETYENRNGQNKKFMDMKQVNPRLGVSWDVNGDGTTKVFGSAGRYSLQIPTHIAVRGASRSLFTRQFFTYTGVDANGAPIGRINQTDPFSTNGEYGQEKNALAVAAQDMKATNQDELTLGFEKQYSPTLNFGVKATYRTLKSTIDDYCDARPFEAWAARNGITPTPAAPLHYAFGCASFNPGEDNVFYVDFAGTGTNLTRVPLTAAELGVPKTKRTYAALDFFAEHPLRNGWYGKVTYTLSRSRGNTEGQTNSDTGQSDVAVTAVWDTPELMDHAYGLLPNDRKHQLKAYGFYQLTPEWQIGANLLAASGRPRSCLGYYNGPNIDDPLFGDFDYGASYHYCQGKPSPRGTLGNLPWDVRLDMNVVYKPNFLKGLELKVDVFNVANRQVAQNVDETYNNNANDNISATYQRHLSTTAPRSVRFTAAYNMSF